MKNTRLTIMAILMFMAVNAFTQPISEYIIIDEIANDIAQLKSEFEGQSNAYVIDGISPNALMQISISIENLQVSDLHIYVLTKPGAIVFNSIAVTTNNIEDWEADLKALSKYVANSVVIHSEIVFSGDEGMLLKQRLEEIAGLVFTAQN